MTDSVPRPGHVVLLGDSVFDNRSRGASEPGVAQDVAAVLRRRLPDAWQVTCRARSGSRIAAIDGQIRTIPEGATHLVASLGGNDALDEARRLREFGSVLAALAAFPGILGRLEAGCDALARSLAAARRPAALCAIYEPRLPDPGLRAMGSAALGAINDVLRTAAERAGVGIIDLALVCTEDSDFSDPIHPSAQGIAKIADAIARWVEAA